MVFRVVQPPREIDSPLTVPAERRVGCTVPLRFVKYRYPHHAAPSGYDRVCDHIDAPAIRPSRAEYWLGETLWRPAGLYHARYGGHFEYSRYDHALEKAVLRDFLSSRGRLYHFIYAEKSFRLTSRFAGRNRHRLIGTVHHPPERQAALFTSRSHFRVFDHLITMDRASVAWWEGITGRANVTWLPHGVDTDFFRPAAIDRERRRFHAVFAGYHQRDVACLERVMARAAADGLPIEFVLIGNSPQMQGMARGQPLARLAHDLSDEEYRAELQAADLLVLPLLTSTVCNTVLEALACGTPVLTTEGGVEDYLSGFCAFVTKVGDAEAMYERLLVQAGFKEGQRLRREDCRSQALRFSWTEIACRYVSLYEQVYFAGGERRAEEDSRAAAPRRRAVSRLNASQTRPPTEAGIQR